MEHVAPKLSRYDRFLIRFYGALPWVFATLGLFWGSGPEPRDYARGAFLFAIACFFRLVRDDLHKALRDESP